MFKSSFSSQKVFHTALVIIPPAEVCLQIQNIRKLYDSAYTRWMPHINILYPFIPPDEFDLFAEKFDKIFKDFENFQVKFQSFGHFEQAKKAVIWVDPLTKGDKIEEINQKLVKELSFFKEERAFHPHLTLGQFEKAGIEKKKEEMIKEWKEAEFTVEEIYLIQRDGQNSSFYIKKSIKLKK